MGVLAVFLGVAAFLAAMRLDGTARSNRLDRWIAWGVLIVAPLITGVVGARLANEDGVYADGSVAVLFSLAGGVWFGFAMAKAKREFLVVALSWWITGYFAAGALFALR